MNFFKNLTLVVPFLILAGCGDSINGAYQASIQYQDEKPRVVGVAIIQNDQIIADGRSVPVQEWKHDGDTITAFGVEGKRLAQFTYNPDGDLVQALPMSRVIYKKFHFD